MDYTTIGIDLGHCQTTAAIPVQPIVNDSRYKVSKLVFDDKNPVINTQIILTNDQMRKLSGKLKPTYLELCQLGEIQIGGDLSPYVPDGEMFCYFKVPPKDFDKPCGNKEMAKRYGITHGQVMACFVFALVNNLLKNNKIELKNVQPKDLVLLIGCPATKNWTDSVAKIKYAKLVKRATAVKEVRIVPESRAAVFSSIENDINKISIVKGVVVFDFGSSTVDCTYMLMGRKIIEFSWNLGASEIEKQMALDAFLTAVKIHGMFDYDTATFAGVVSELRVAKEFYYNGKYKYEPNGHALICPFQPKNGGQIIDIPIRINDSFMEKVTGEKTIQILCDSKTSKTGTWKSLCEDFLTEARNRIQESYYIVKDQNGNTYQQNCEFDTVVLTGGASKMGFVTELCKAVFPDVTIHVEDNPAHTVSNGLGWVAVSDSNFETCLAAAKSEIDSMSSCSVDVLRKSISDAVFAKLSGIAIKKTDEWANKPGDDLTARDLQNSINGCINSPATQKELNDICEKAINSWKDSLSSSIETAVNNQVKKLYANSVAKGLMIPNDIWKQLQTGVLPLNVIDTSKVLEGIDMAGFGTAIGKTIIQIVIWIIGWALAAETFAISLLAALLAHILSEVVLTDEDLDKKRSQKIRKKVAGKIKSKMGDYKGEMMKSFDERLQEQTADFDKILDETMQAALEIVTLKRFDI